MGVIQRRSAGRACAALAKLCALGLILGTSLLLTGCERARDRREARDATQTAQEAPSPPAGVPEATSVPAAPAPQTPLRGSPGCGTPAASGPSIGSLDSDGVPRRFRLYIPAGYRPSTPTPLVLNFHGFGSTALEQERYSEYPAAADKYGFVVVTPEGTGTPQQWFLYGPVEDEYVDDFAFAGRLIDELSATLCIDPARVYATGLSNGGGMTSLAGCKLSDRLAAIAPVAGSPYVTAQCQDAGPMPVIAFHGTDDRLVPFEPGPDIGRLDLFRFGVRNNMREWAEHNGCNPALKTERIAADVVLESYLGCKDGADVQLYVVEGGGHVWPGARVEINALGYTTHSISATELSWLFFAAHPKK